MFLVFRAAPGPDLNDDKVTHFVKRICAGHLVAEYLQYLQRVSAEVASILIGILVQKDSSRPGKSGRSTRGLVKARTRHSRRKEKHKLFPDVQISAIKLHELFPVNQTLDTEIIEKLARHLINEAILLLHEAFIVFFRLMPNRDDYIRI